MQLVGRVRRSSRPSRPATSRRPSAVRRGARAVRDDRAGGRELRRPRPEIDARVNDVEHGDRWTGFHRIERRCGSTTRRRAWARSPTSCCADCRTLERKTRTLSYQPDELANGANGLLDEVASSKITGEEDRYSHTDLSDFEANVSGAQTTFGLLAPALADPKLAKTIGRASTRCSRSSPR